MFIVLGYKALPFLLDWSHYRNNSSPALLVRTTLTDMSLSGNLLHAIADIIYTDHQHWGRGSHYNSYIGKMNIGTIGTPWPWCPFRAHLILVRRLALKPHSRFCSSRNVSLPMSYLLSNVIPPFWCLTCDPVKYNVHSTTISLTSATTCCHSNFRLAF